MQSVSVSSSCGVLCEGQRIFAHVLQKKSQTGEVAGRQNGDGLDESIWCQLTDRLSAGCIPLN
jgi:hypothetical protein